jgi:hypothetical protein
MSSFRPAQMFSFLAAAIMLACTSPAMAQAANPLQPRAAGPAKPATAEEKPATTTEKPKRERSPAQLANDNRLRKCGAEWRAGKEKLTAQGYNWIKFSTECRARLKAAGQ